VRACRLWRPRIDRRPGRPRRKRPISPRRVHSALRSGRHHPWLPGALLLAAAVALRVVLALRPGLWVDEIFSLAIATGHSLEHPAAQAIPELGDWIEPAEPRPAAEYRRFLEHEAPPAGPARVIRATLLSDTNPPLYYLILDSWLRAAGTSDAALRSLSALFALACLPLVFRIGRRLGGRRVAWIACLLFALSPPALHYSAEGRMYSLTWLLALGLAELSQRIARSPRGPLFALFGLVAGAALLTHYFLAFVVAACLGWLLVHSRAASRLGIALATALASLLAAPWYLRLPESLAAWRVTAGWLAGSLSAWETVKAPVLLAWSFVGSYGLWGGSKLADALLALLFAGLLAHALRRGARRLLVPSRQLVLAWALASCIGPLAFDFLQGTRASLLARYALPGLPAGLLLAALLVARLPRRLAPAALALILLAWLPGWRGAFSAEARPSQPFPEIARRLDAWGHGSELVIVHSIPSGVLGVSRYVDPRTPIASWVPQLGMRCAPDDLPAWLEGRCRAALVKIHDLGEPSPAEAWLATNATLERRDVIVPGTEILYFERVSFPTHGSAICPPVDRRLRS